MKIRKINTGGRKLLPSNENFFQIMETIINKRCYSSQVDFLEVPIRILAKLWLNSQVSQTNKLATKGFFWLGNNYVYFLRLGYCCCIFNAKKSTFCNIDMITRRLYCFRWNITLWTVTMQYYSGEVSSLMFRRIFAVALNIS